MGGVLDQTSDRQVRDIGVLGADPRDRIEVAVRGIGQVVPGGQRGEQRAGIEVTGIGALVGDHGLVLRPGERDDLVGADDRDMTQALWSIVLDPHLNGSDDVVGGRHITRVGVPCVEGIDHAGDVGDVDDLTTDFCPRGQRGELRRCDVPGPVP